MSSLARSQALLLEAMRKPSALVEDADLAAIASGNDRLSPIEQIDIYREQFWLRHIDVLRDDFAALEKLLGEEPFDRLARDYLIACPSASFSLRDLGVDLPRFLERSGDAFAVEVARVEWAFVECFDGPDTLPFDPSSIAAITEDAWPLVRVLVDPSLQLLDLAYPAHDYRIAARKDDAVTRPEPRACSVAIYRGPELLHCLEIEPAAAALLRELAKNTPLGEACERIAAIEDVQAKIGGWFAEWTSLGWIRAVLL